MTETLGVGARGEWFRDQDGVRCGAEGAGCYAVTLGMNWQPLSWLTFRPELRRDWADAPARLCLDGRARAQ
jgi:hypothetical protein